MPPAETPGKMRMGRRPSIAWEDRIRPLANETDSLNARRKLADDVVGAWKERIMIRRVEQAREGAHLRSECSSPTSVSQIDGLTKRNGFTCAVQIGDGKVGKL